MISEALRLYMFFSSLEWVGAQQLFSPVQL